MQTGMSFGQRAELLTNLRGSACAEPLESLAAGVSMQVWVKEPIFQASSSA